MSATFGVAAPGTTLQTLGPLISGDNSVLPATSLIAGAAGKGFYGLALQASNFAALHQLPADPGRRAGAVQPAHRHAEQPEGRAQGGQRRVVRHRRDHQHHHLGQQQQRSRRPR
jgi:hypothetical protein